MSVIGGLTIGSCGVGAVGGGGSSVSVCGWGWGWGGEDAVKRVELLNRFTSWIPGSPSSTYF